MHNLFETLAEITRPQIKNPMKKFTSTLTFTFQVEVTGEAKAAPDFLNHVKQIQMKGQLVMPLEPPLIIDAYFEHQETCKIQTIKIADQ